jgi:osmotically-inducible protein OsmY
MPALLVSIPLGELASRVEQALAGCLALARYELAFDVEPVAVTLRGQVTSYYHKQLAQESLQRVAGVRAIRNEIKVCRPTASRSTANASS